MAVVTDGGDTHTEGHDKGDGHGAGGHAAGVKGHGPVIRGGQGRQQEHTAVQANQQPLERNPEQDAQHAQHQEDAHAHADGHDQHRRVDGGDIVRQHGQVGLGHRHRDAQQEADGQNQQQVSRLGQLGADMVAAAESKELAEKGFLTSSCCPAFVQYVKSAFPALLPYVSHNLSPMATLAKYIKGTDPTAKVVFIGPCTAKKAEAQLDSVKPYIDSVMTFEELQALYDSCDIDITSLDEDVLDNASFYGRIFARSGGLSDAVAQGLKEQNIEFDLKAIPCDGIEECRMALLKKQKNVLDANFIEGMACIGGCIGGAGCLTHGEKNKAQVDVYGREAFEKTISEATAILK